LISEIGIGAHRISELVRVVKEYSYLDQAPVQDVEITKGIDDTLILLKHKLRGIEVVKSYQDGLHRVEAPGRDLNQVWTNLIDNAADAMGEGGRLTIDAFNQDSMVVVRFHDTGPGIPKEIAERIFDPFFTTKEPGKGTGLGLHTVHTIVGRVGGNITVDTDGSGTTFIVTLPSAA
jgi:signal transduction histidine kinase